jgi:ParB-like chromosome segregation protein Spo0J
VEFSPDISKEQMPASQVSICRVDINEIIVPEDGREHAEADVAVMADSARLIGIQTPISIDGNKRLIRGKLRLLGAKRAGLTTIDCFVVGDTAIHHLWKIAENLHRSELSVLERSAALVQWSELTKGGQLEQVSGGRGKKGGIAEAARALGVDRNVLRRAVAIAAIPPETCAAIRTAGLDDHQAALLSIAVTPIEQQLEKIKEHSNPKISAPSSLAKLQLQALLRAWENADKRTRMRFITEIVQPYIAQSQPDATAH